MLGVIEDTKDFRTRRGSTLALLPADVNLNFAHLGQN